MARLRARARAWVRVRTRAREVREGRKQEDGWDGKKKKERDWVERERESASQPTSLEAEAGRPWIGNDRELNHVEPDAKLARNS